MRSLYLLAAPLVLAVLGAATIAACGSDSTDGASEKPNGQDPTPSLGDPDATVDPNTGGLIVTPADPVIEMVDGQAPPTVQFLAATKDNQQVPAVFSIDRGELGTITPQGLFTPSGKTGGKATITATWSGRTGTTTVTVKLKVRENGATADGPGGSGGYGGVGGEGPGAAVDDATIAVLTGTATPDPNLSLLYPYTDTVWPRGVLAPLLQWKPGAQGDYDAVYIHVTEAAFEYEGFFKKTKAPFTHHPIPQATWKKILSSNGGEDVNVTLTFAKGGAAYGTITTKWKVASAPLKGTVYYNSYGTKLAKNYTGAKGGVDDKFGGATLAVRGGSTEPKLVAGGDGSAANCRVCHSVAADGSVLITQRGEAGDRAFSTYDLKGPTETVTSGTNYAWPAIYPDGSLFLGDSSDAAGSNSNVNQLYQTASGGGTKTPAPVTTQGWPAGLRAAFPVFSPDGKGLAFTMYAGMTGADKRTLGAMTFDKGTSTWSNMTPIYTPPNAAHQALYPSYLPTNDAIVFQLMTRPNTRGYGETRADGDSGASADIGARAELWWIDVATKTAHPLEKLNGVGYVPSRADTGHADDATLNYEPTVNPVPSGGYAWVVFTSRRMYGDVATINPYHSDPRNFDLTTTPTPKKLWVAAIDLNAPPGTDPSHPAFYLPAQELLAGNSRGYWVVDPCNADGATCETGDECCGGYCRPNSGGQLVCTTQAPTCSQEFEKCNTDGDCCNSPSIKCINNRCASPGPR
ncbi:hypothetical protein AKJ09_05454 [Labilithrix luteola]|uniref:TolB protein n=1 Tax=Labilithrix luteola TaxID=1391654 RepID=A0A0K1PZ36_9BACT|nr:hypothetical protein [Labilithrix luteola]AKU98790.1 hypothetical protein AKJ09_05454 [Labilithrix luteola]